MGTRNLGEDEAIHGRLVTAYDKNAKEPWSLVTDLDEVAALDIVNIYRRRWWIEALFREKNNRAWGMGLAVVNLKDHRRYERLLHIVALAFIFLNAHGAAAEAEGFDRGLKANTRKIRIINPLRMGYHFIKQEGCELDCALAA